MAHLNRFLANLGVASILAVPVFAQYPNGFVSDNCGYSAVCAVLARLNLSIDVQRVRRTLKIDSHHIRHLSFLSLKTCLEDHGLKVVAMMGDVGEVGEAIRQSAVSILHTNTALDDHFVVIWKKDEQFIVYDHPKVTSLSMTEFEVLMEESTGNLLCVTRLTDALDLEKIKKASNRLKSRNRNAANGLAVNVSGPKQIGDFKFSERCLVPLPEPKGQQVQLNLDSLVALPAEFELKGAAGDCSCFRGVTGKSNKGLNISFDKDRLYERIANGGRPKVTLRYKGDDGSEVTQIVTVVASRNKYRFRFGSMHLDLGEIKTVAEKRQPSVVEFYVDGDPVEVEHAVRGLVPRIKCSEGFDATWKRDVKIGVDQTQSHKIGEVLVTARPSRPGLFVGSLELWDDSGNIAPSSLKITGIVE